MCCSWYLKLLSSALLFTRSAPVFKPSSSVTWLAHLLGEAVLLLDVVSCGLHSSINVVLNVTSFSGKYQQYTTHVTVECKSGWIRFMWSVFPKLPEW